MTEDRPSINIVAAVGPGGSLGPRDGIPLFVDHEEGHIFNEFFVELSKGGLVVMDREIAVKLSGFGFRGFPEADLLLWNGEPVEDFLEHFKEIGKPVFVTGSAAIFEAFNPWATQFFIRRAELQGPHETFMPNPFGPVN